MQIAPAFWNIGSQGVTHISSTAAIDRKKLTSLIHLSDKGISLEKLRQHFQLKGRDIETALEPAIDALVKQGQARWDEDEDRVYSNRPTPRTILARVTGRDSNGHLRAVPTNWGDRDVNAPRLIIHKRQIKGYGLDKGARVLVRVKDTHGQTQKCNIVRKLFDAGSADLTGIFRKTSAGWYVISAQDGQRAHYRVTGVDRHSFYRDGDSVVFRVDEQTDQSSPSATIQGFTWTPEISAHRLSDYYFATEGIRVDVPHDIRKEAKRLADQPIRERGRTNLKHLPFMTIDPESARDFDDAVHAARDDDPNNRGGWNFWVAIADVAHYVKPNSPLDRMIRSRGFSVYPPDRAIHMLPNELAEGACSLQPNRKRYALSLHFRFDKDGNLLSMTPHRSVVKSRAKLSYEQAEKAMRGETKLRPDLQKALEGLQTFYELILKPDSEARGELQLMRPAPVVNFDSQGNIRNITEKPFNQATDMIEKMMVFANAKVAEDLHSRKIPYISRIHEEPNKEDYAYAARKLKEIKVDPPEGDIWSQTDINAMLEDISDTDRRYQAEAILLGSLIKQARCGVDDTGHWGLNLKRYAHFTSPIRRMHDLWLHRAMIFAYGLGNDGYIPEISEMKKMAEQTYDLEQQARAIEKKSFKILERAWFQQYVGKTLKARICTLTPEEIGIRFGDNPTVHTFKARVVLPTDSYSLINKGRTLYGKKMHKVCSIGDEIDVTIKKSEPLPGLSDPDTTPHALMMEPHIINRVEAKPLRKKRVKHSRTQRLPNSIRKNVDVTVTDISTKAVRLSIPCLSEEFETSVTNALPGSIALSREQKQTTGRKGVYVYDWDRTVRPGDTLTATIAFRSGSKAKRYGQNDIMEICLRPPRNPKGPKPAELRFSCLRDATAHRHAVANLVNIAASKGSDVSLAGRIKDKEAEKGQAQIEIEDIPDMPLTIRVDNPAAIVPGREVVLTAARRDQTDSKLDITIMDTEKQHEIAATTITAAPAGDKNANLVPQAA